MNKRNWLTLLGFGLFTLGTLSIILELVGLKFGILSWLEAFGPLGSFMVKMLMIFGGVVLAVLAFDDEESYDEFFDGKGKGRRN